MALNIKHPEADRLARQLSKVTGKSLTEAVVDALRDKLARTTQRPMISLASELAAIRLRCAAMPVLDSRTPDEILGYDDAGLPG